jgi:hypothetical protein
MGASTMTEWREVDVIPGQQAVRTVRTRHRYVVGGIDGDSPSRQRDKEQRAVLISSAYRTDADLRR